MSEQQTRNTDTSHTIKVLLVDDHAMMREGTRRLLEEDPMLAVIGEAQDGAEALLKCQQFKPDVLILDISMKGMNGFGVMRALQGQRHTPAILVLTAYDEIAYVHAMLKMGCKGYWLKSAHGSEIRQAVHDVATRKKSLDPAIRRLLAASEEGVPVSIEPLTSREIAVLQLVVQGVRNIEIGLRLGLAVKTVEMHLTNIYGKLGVQSRAEAIALAQRQGLLLEREEIVKSPRVETSPSPTPFTDSHRVGTSPTPTIFTDSHRVGTSPTPTTFTDSHRVGTSPTPTTFTDRDMH
jgi:DNA-binding NarL/FixJ family response regulator